MKQLLLFLILCFTLSSCAVFLENSAVKNYKPEEKIDKKGLNDYQYDFLYLSKLLQEGYPQLDSVFPVDSREKMESEILDRLSQDNLKDIDFGLQTRKYLSQVKNQHTWISILGKVEQVYPFITLISDSKWYLINIDKRYDSLYVGKKIKSLIQCCH